MHRGDTLATVMVGSSVQSTARTSQPIANRRCGRSVLESNERRLADIQSTLTRCSIEGKVQLQILDAFIYRIKQL
jgi:hypothetical protein